MKRFSHVGGGGNLLSSRSKGFTLAEVLVTLGIIGVVSAMTVPSLMQNHQRKTYVTQLHKVYNELSQAFLQYQTDKNALNLKEAGLISAADVNDFMNKYFKIVKYCPDSLAECFWDGGYRNINGTKLNDGSFWYGSEKVPCYALANGASVCVEWVTLHGTFGHLTIDVNGKKGPNIAGRDLFFIAFYNDGTIDEEGVPSSCRASGTGCGSGKTSAKDARAALGCAGRSDAKGCFGLILNDNWDMTY